jgi:3-isopropylmalate/(R)-2-methylmalate dehydratase small subunit
METTAKFVYGDHVDTDRIIPGKYTKTLDLSSLAAHVLEDLDPGFAGAVEPGDILVAGDNFGCGSSREQAPVALLQAGVRLVIARYFARIFFRNAINIGLPVLEIPDHRICRGDRLLVDLPSNTVVNVSQQITYRPVPMPPIMLEILQEGGMVAYLKKSGGYGGDLGDYTPS